MQTNFGSKVNNTISKDSRIIISFFKKNPEKDLSSFYIQQQLAIPISYFPLLYNDINSQLAKEEIQKEIQKEKEKEKDREVEQFMVTLLEDNNKFQAILSFNPEFIEIKYQDETKQNEKLYLQEEKIKMIIHPTKKNRIMFWKNTNKYKIIILEKEETRTAMVNSFIRLTAPKTAPFSNTKKVKNIYSNFKNAFLNFMASFPQKIALEPEINAKRKDPKAKSLFCRNEDEEHIIYSQKMDFENNEDYDQENEIINQELQPPKSTFYEFELMNIAHFEEEQKVKISLHQHFFSIEFKNTKIERVYSIYSHLWSAMTPNKSNTEFRFHIDEYDFILIRLPNYETRIGFFFDFYSKRDESIRYKQNQEKSARCKMAHLGETSDVKIILYRDYFLIKKKKEHYLSAEYTNETKIIKKKDANLILQFGKYKEILLSFQNSEDAHEIMKTFQTSKILFLMYCRSSNNENIFFEYLVYNHIPIGFSSIQIFPDQKFILQPDLHYIKICLESEENPKEERMVIEYPHFCRMKIEIDRIFDVYFAKKESRETFLNLIEKNSVKKTIHFFIGFPGNFIESPEKNVKITGEILGSKTKSLIIISQKEKEPKALNLSELQILSNSNNPFLIKIQLKQTQAQIFFLFDSLEIRTQFTEFYQQNFKSLEIGNEDNSRVNSQQDNQKIIYKISFVNAKAQVLCEGFLELGHEKILKIQKKNQTIQRKIDYNLRILCSKKDPVFARIILTFSNSHQKSMFIKFETSEEASLFYDRFATIRNLPDEQNLNQNLNENLNKNLNQNSNKNRKSKSKTKSKTKSK
ncbi:hypothetical protein M0811_00114 [Anaeramoeba ignava]|uniref:Uncharacterized protein n=1 Tax=Anaeramoeba ignava TaxID=1746090 RepID=A0A9Q0RE41_ANAIG|nr:hypothetical protein M0811_00114 [Anaeramoeba ignava]